MQGQVKKDAEFYHKNADSLKFVNPELAIENYVKSKEILLEQNDTLKAVRLMISIAELYSHNINYSASYDSYWEALLLAEKKNSQMWEGRAYQGLGYLYSYFNRNDEALKYLNKSLEISKELNKKLKIPLTYSLSDYFALANFYRYNEDFESARIYLDSANFIQKKVSVGNKNYHVETEKGFLLAQQGDFKEGLKILEEAKRFYTERDKSYLVIVDHLMGRVYSQMKNYKLSEELFLQSIKVSEEYNSHMNYRVINYEALSKLYSKTAKYKLALDYLQKAKTLNDEVFGSKSKGNQELLEIKDTYRTTKENQVNIENKHRLAELEYEKNVNRFEMIILLGSLVFIVLFGLVFVRNLRLKHSTEKKLIKERQEIALQRQSDILEIKNKELTTSALQLIEKEEFLTNLNLKLAKQKDTIDVKTISRMVKSVQGNPTSNWEEFETRFTSVNQSFYKNLKLSFPKLSVTDHKICALIKLKFSSKEMSSLLGISVESVHTSRYRLRKKMGLDRNDNLYDFINSI
jgi:tetratricopeptide (TPR) repeat protein